MSQLLILILILDNKLYFVQSSVLLFFFLFHSVLYFVPFSFKTAEEGEIYDLEYKTVYSYFDAWILWTEEFIYYIFR